MAITYLVVLTYIKPLKDVDEQMSAHIEWLKKGYSDGAFLASGRRVPRNGGVIIAQCNDIHALEQRLSQDPFQKMGIAESVIIPFEASMKSEALQDIF
ncbi:YciI family protein [Morganella sp. EGD-HP17]|uniref:YciI family protein n=1 Tax=Morganella sp. EGD-HP17 TaxID=1435146 RepID=UPI000400CC6D|nr:YciI family protein [Morganella sp. EGD-HP17]ETO41204.1 GTP cyclohydrolase II [Morganella sp. EGD-HP17]